MLGHQIDVLEYVVAPIVRPDPCGEGHCLLASSGRGHQPRRSCLRGASSFQALHSNMSVRRRCKANASPMARWPGQRKRTCETRALLYAEANAIPKSMQAACVSCLLLVRRSNVIDDYGLGSMPERHYGCHCEHQDRGLIPQHRRTTDGCFRAVALVQSRQVYTDCTDVYCNKRRL